MNAQVVARQTKERCPSHWAGFGLTPEYIEKITYEHIFILKQHGNWSFSEAYSLPIKLREWFVTRLINELTPDETN